jgi:CHAT domain-containing protein
MPSEFDDASDSAEKGSESVASILRGGAWERGFAPLTYSGLEAREIGALYGEVFGEDAPSIVLEKRQASRAAIESLAPKARWLHVATHGWFASESIASWQDGEPLDRHTGIGVRLSTDERVRGMSPMLLCGLALAGANLPENEHGSVPGLVTAEELSALDLTNCELVVLSACDTNVGERRAGQGVASLQMALQMAGARSAITSLWKVPDEATRELMTDFYRRIWVEKKPKGQALWEAKMRLREAKDESGNAKYTTRDWAAWILTGDPD